MENNGTCFVCGAKAYMQPPRRGRNADKGLSDGLERIGGEPRGFHGAVDGADSEREPIGRLSSREVHRIHRWGRAFEGDGHGLHAENTRACLKNKNCTKRMFYFPFS